MTAGVVGVRFSRRSDFLVLEGLGAMLFFDDVSLADLLGADVSGALSQLDDDLLTMFFPF